MSELDIIVVTIDRNAATAVAAAFSPGTSEPVVAERLGIDGSMAEWVAIGVAAIQSFGGILAVVSGLLGRKRVRRIKFGDYEVDNPTPEDLAIFREMMRDRGTSSGR